MILHYNSLLIDSIEYKLSELQIEKRREFIKILNKLVHKLKFRSQTFYLACFYFDYIIKFNKEIKGIAECIILNLEIFRWSKFNCFTIKSQTIFTV